MATVRDIIQNIQRSNATLEEIMARVEELAQQRDVFKAELVEARGLLKRAGEKAVADFIERVNQRAEAEMERTGTLEGAHHRAIELEADAYLRRVE